MTVVDNFFQSPENIRSRLSISHENADLNWRHSMTSLTVSWNIRLNPAEPSTKRITVSDYWSLVDSFNDLSEHLRKQHSAQQDVGLLYFFSGNNFSPLCTEISPEKLYVCRMQSVGPDHACTLVNPEEQRR